MLTLAVVWAVGPAAANVSTALGGGTLGAASSAGFTSLATQASITLVNNKGNVKQTLEDLATDETARAILTAALTAGALDYVNNSVMPGVFDKLSIEDAKNLQGRLVNGAFEGTTSALVDTVINGGSLTDNLETALLNSSVDAAQGFAASGIKNFENQYILHKILHAAAGCAAAAAKQAECEAGAIGAGIGEIVASATTTPEDALLIKLGLISPDRLEEIETTAKLITGVIAAYSGYDVDIAIDATTIAIKNNHNIESANNVQISEEDALRFKAMIGFALPIDMAEELTNASQNGATYAELGQILGIEGALYLTQAKMLNKTFDFLKKANKACFVAGTLVETIDGLKPIETIQQGDLVWSRHEDSLEYGYKPVTGTGSFKDKEIYEVIVQDSNGNTEIFETTEEHPFWVVSAGWLPAKMLQAGMTLVNRDNEQTLKVVSQTKLNKTDTVYNFEVDEFHTYHIGEFGVWVHNACVPDITNATAHGALRVTERGFNQNKIAEIVTNYSEKGYQPGGLTVYTKKQSNGNYDVLIVNSDNQIVSAIGGTKESLPNRRTVMTMLNNNGGFSGIPLDY